MFGETGAPADIAGRENSFRAKQRRWIRGRGHESDALAHSFMSIRGLNVETLSSLPECVRQPVGGVDDNNTVSFVEDELVLLAKRVRSLRMCSEAPCPKPRSERG